MLDLAVNTVASSYRIMKHGVSDFAADPILSLEKALAAVTCGFGGYLAAFSALNYSSDNVRNTIQWTLTGFVGAVAAILAETEGNISSASQAEQLMMGAAIGGSAFIAHRFYRELFSAAVGTGAGYAGYHLVPGQSMYKLPPAQEVINQVGGKLPRVDEVIRHYAPQGPRMG